MDTEELILDYSHSAVEELGINAKTAKHFGIGYCNQGPMSEKVAFKIVDHEGTFRGYLCFKDGVWSFPKSFKWDTLYNLFRVNREAVVLTVSVLDVVHINKFFPFVIGLMDKSITDAQLELLRSFRRILLLSSEPENIRNRLSEFAFVKTPKLEKPVSELTKDELQKMF